MDNKSVLILAAVCCFLTVSSSIGGALYWFRCDLGLADCPDEDQKGCPARQECSECPDDDQKECPACQECSECPDEDQGCPACQECSECPDEDQKGCPACQECPKIHDDIIRVESVQYNNSNKFLKVKLNLEENGNVGDTRSFSARFVPLGGGPVKYCTPATNVNVKKDGIYYVDFSGIDDCFREVSDKATMSWAVIIHSQTYKGNTAQGDWKVGAIHGNFKNNVTR